MPYPKIYRSSFVAITHNGFLPTGLLGDRNRVVEEMNEKREFSHKDNLPIMKPDWASFSPIISIIVLEASTLED